MCTILNGSQLGIYSLVMLNKTEGKENWKEKEKQVLSAIKQPVRTFSVPSPMLDYLEQSD